VNKALCLAALLACTACQSAQPSLLPKTTIAFPKGRQITVEVAHTPHARERGLMFRKELASDYGMLFVFPKQLALQFWMKNTWVDLDMIFLGSEKKINHLYHNVPHSNPGDAHAVLAKRHGFGQYVLELPAGAAKGYGLKVGDQLIFNAPKALR